MLHADAIHPQSLDLLTDLQACPALSDTRLVGGTALGLHLGHRISVDLDCFGPLSDPDDTECELRKLGDISVRNRSERIRSYVIRGVQVDLVDYPYPWLENAVEDQGVRLAAISDIAAMKVAAITNRGAKKDFIDLAFLLREFSLREVLAWYEAKFDDSALFHAVKSLTYFADAEPEPMPTMLASITWDEVKAAIRLATSDLAG